MKKNNLLLKIKNKIKQLITRNYKIYFSKVIYYKVFIFLDKIYGLDFYTPMSLKQLGLEPDSNNVHYGATRSYEINKVLRESGVQKEDSVMDFGSGKGLMLYDCYRFGIKKICGVELSEIACNIAKNNFEKLGISSINIEQVNATEIVAQLDDYSVFYFYNPFGPETLDVVINNITQSIKRSPRSVKIIYHFPIDKNIIEKTGLFDLVYDYAPYFFGGQYLVYESNNLSQAGVKT